jgi:hypothetical protein
VQGIWPNYIGNANQLSDGRALQQAMQILEQLIAPAGGSIVGLTPEGTPSGLILAAPVGYRSPLLAEPCSVSQLQHLWLMRCGAELPAAACTRQLGALIEGHQGSSSPLPLLQ